MKRREFISLLGGAAAAAWPLAARAQQAAKVVRLGYLAAARLPNLIEALRAGLRDFGYVEGQNLAIEYRFALGQTKSYDELAQELVSLDPAAIVLTGTPAALALKRQTTTIPIILAPIVDPIALGLARSLARPGGNVTGLTMFGPELAHKRMEIFREAAAGGDCESTHSGAMARNELGNSIGLGATVAAQRSGRDNGALAPQLRRCGCQQENLSGLRRHRVQARNL